MIYFKVFLGLELEQLMGLKMKINFNIRLYLSPNSVLVMPHLVPISYPLSSNSYPSHYRHPYHFIVHILTLVSLYVNRLLN